MEDVKKLRIMISSRSLSKVFGEIELAQLRLRLQARLQSVRWQAPPLAGEPGAGSVLVGRDQPLFDVWIHENDPGEAGAATTLQISLREIDRANLVIVLNIGEAGSAAFDSDLGICHAELHEAWSRRADIVAVIDLLPLSASALRRDAVFRKFVEDRSLFHKTAASEQELHERVFELLQELFAKLADRGSLGGRGTLDRGAPLDWSRLDLAQRQDAMRLALRKQLLGEEADTGAQLLPVAFPSGQKVLARPDAIPAALTVAAARERVGQPFLHDHEHAEALAVHDLPGVLHVIACQRGVTESQALRILGTPDAIAVSSDFGVFAADHVQKIQLVLLARCSAPTAISLRVRQWNEWLVQSEEEANVIRRAQGRRAIIEVLHRVR